MPISQIVAAISAIALATVLVLPQRQTVAIGNMIRRLSVDLLGTAMGTRTGDATQ